MDGRGASQWLSPEDVPAYPVLRGEPAPGFDSLDRSSHRPVWYRKGGSAIGWGCVNYGTAIVILLLESVACLAQSLASHSRS